MWFISGWKMNPGMRLEMLDSEDLWDIAPGESDRQMNEARVHGNAQLDTCTIGWQGSTAEKRAENDYYDAVYSGDMPPGFIKDLFRQAPSIVNHIQGSFYIIDVNDPELVEFGELYIQERLTSHLAEVYVKPESEMPEWAPDVRHYVEGLFLNNLARGFADSGPALNEPIRQGLGLPYEWHGAPID